MTRSYSIREFQHLLGREMAEIAHEDGIFTSAFKSRVPIFCPAIIVGRIDVQLDRTTIMPTAANAVPHFDLLMLVFIVDLR